MDESTSDEAPDVRAITLSVHTYNDDKWDHAWQRFTRLTHELGDEYLHVGLTTYRLSNSDTDFEEGEYFDEYTMFKVIDAIKRVSAGVTDGFAREIVNEMQNAGILFRERK